MERSVSDRREVPEHGPATGLSKSWSSLKQSMTSFWH